MSDAHFMIYRFIRDPITYNCNSLVQRLTVLILLSVHSLARSFASLVTSSDASAMLLAQAIRSFLEPPSPLTN